MLGCAAKSEEPRAKRRRNSERMGDEKVLGGLRLQTKLWCLRQDSNYDGAMIWACNGCVTSKRRSSCEIHFEFVQDAMDGSCQGKILSGLLSSKE